MLPPFFVFRSLLAMSLLAAGGVGAQIEVVETPATTAATQPQERGFRWVGSASCSSAGCHGGADRPRFSAGDPWSPAAYHVWVQNDPHAQSYYTLLSEQSRRMVKLLGWRPAHREERCLVCHAPEGAGKPMTVSQRHTPVDGVGCESCHGPAEGWLAPHSRPEWMALSPAAKSQRGLRDLDSLAVRSEVCADCHVGSPGLDVNHDLLAAGHPRLAFEMSSLHNRLPKHWVAEREPAATLDAKLWAVGRLIAAASALELLAERAHDADRPWPEFSEYDCAACHHALAEPSWRQDAARFASSRVPGSLPWGDWNYALTETAGGSGSAPQLRRARGRLAEEMQRPIPDRDRVETVARRLYGAYRTEAELLSRTTIDGGDVDNWMRRLSAADAATDLGWDGVAQRTLALAATHYSSAASPAGSAAAERRRRLIALRELLRSAAPDSWSEYSARASWDAALQAEARSHFDAIHRGVAPTR